MKSYTENHEWVEFDDDVVVVGISEHAAEQLGDLVFVELPQLNSEFAASETVAVLESVKAASDVYTPYAGEIVAINDKLADDPELVNRDPEGGGWLFKIRTDGSASPDALMDPGEYQNFLQQ